MADEDVSALRWIYGEEFGMANPRHQTFILLLHTRVFCAQRVAIMPLILFPPSRV